MTLSCCHAGLSDPGQVRNTNEDRWTAEPSIGLYMVVDGMGGHPCGELAADIVVKTFPQQVACTLPEISKPFDDHATRLLQMLLRELSNGLVERTRCEPGLQGMGSTVVSVLIQDRRCLILHLGDSRVYLLRDAQLTRLTKDHTITQLLVDRNEISQADARDHPARHQLTRFVGMENAPLPDANLIELQSRDRLLLCSDGLSNTVDEAQLKGALSRENEPSSVCAELIAAANEGWRT